MVQYTIPLEPIGSRGIVRFSTGLPLSADLRGGEVRGRSLLVVSAVAAGTTALEAGKEHPARGMQNPLCGVEKKWFPGVCSAAPGVMVYRPGV